MNKLNMNKLKPFFNIEYLTLAILFFISLLIFKRNVLICDDILFHFLTTEITPFKGLFYGTWLMHFQNMLMYCLPDFFDIHLQDWAMGFGALFKSFILTFMIFIYIKFIKLEISDKKIIIPLSLILYFFIFIWSKDSFFVDFVIFEGFFRFIIPGLLLLIYFYVLYMIVSGKKYNIFLLGILAIITGNSSEIAAYIAIVTTLFISFLQKEKEKRKILYKLSACLTYGFLFIVFSENITSHFMSGHVSKDFVLGSIISELADFFKIYYVKLIYNFRFYYAGILILLFLNLYKKTNKSKIIFPVAILIAINIFAFSIFFLGKTSYNQDFWLDHIDIYFVLIPIFMLSFLLLLNCFISKFNENVKSKISIILICIVILMLNPFYKSASALKNTLSNIREYSYVRDKIRMFYIFKDSDAVLSPFVHLEATFRLIGEKKISIEDTERVRFSSFVGKSFNDFLEAFYYTNIYKVPRDYPPKKIQIAENNKEAIEKFKEAGGTLDEINLDNYKFSNLLKKEFVLNSVNR